MPLEGLHVQLFLTRHARARPTQSDWLLMSGLTLLRTAFRSQSACSARLITVGAMADAPPLGVINTSVCGNGLGILSINRQKGAQRHEPGYAGPLHFNAAAFITCMRTT